MGNRELHLLEPRHAAQVVIAGMPGAHIGEVVDPVQLFGGQHPHRRVLDQHFVPVALDERPAGHLVLVVHLEAGGLRVVFLVPGHHFKIGALDSSPGGLLRRAEVAGAADIPHLMDILPRRQPVDDFDRLQFPHPEGEEVGPGVDEDAGVHRVRPVVVMGKPPERRLQAADDNRHIRPVDPADGLCVDGERPVRAVPRLAAGGVGVVVPAGEGDGIVGDHRVDVPRVDHKAVLRPAEAGVVVVIAPIRLGDNPDGKPLRLDHPGDNRRPEARVVDIGVAGDEDKVQLGDAGGVHLVPGGWQESMQFSHRGPPFFRSCFGCCARFVSGRKAVKGFGSTGGGRLGKGSALSTPAIF